MARTSAPQGAPLHPRVRVFVDYWNLQLTINECVSKATGVADLRFRVDWQKFSKWLAGRAAHEAGLTQYSYDGTIVYASHDANTTEGKKFREWATNWLNRQPGIQVQCRARRPRSAPKCNHCYQPITACPACGKMLSGTVEKGVDTAIPTDMIRLAWEDAYELAVLVSLDADLVPAVQFLDAKGRKVIQAGFPPKGQELMKACWASVDLFKDRANFERP